MTNNLPIIKIDKYSKDGEIDMKSLLYDAIEGESEETVNKRLDDTRGSDYDGLRIGVIIEGCVCDINWSEGMFLIHLNIYRLDGIELHNKNIGVIRLSLYSTNRKLKRVI